MGKPSLPKTPVCLRAASRRPGAPILYSLAAAVFLFLTSAPVPAVEVTSLYTAEVPLAETGRDPRAAAYAEALRTVLLRVSGSDLADDPERVRALFPNPSLYVVQYRPGQDDTLWVSFDGRAIEGVLRQAGQRVWGAERPLTLVWLAVDRGQGERAIIAAGEEDEPLEPREEEDPTTALRERFLEIADTRGLPIVFPLLDTEDLSRVSFADVWGGFDERVLAASERYEADSVLIGRLRPETRQQNRWTYYFGDDQQAWTGEPEAVLGLVADRLAAEYAIGGDATLSSVDLAVSGVTSVDAYGAVDRLLSEVSVIDRYLVVSVEGDRIRYRMDVHGGGERLARALRLAGLLEQDRIAGGSTSSELATLEFFYEP